MFEEEYQKRINRVVQFIEANLEERLTLQQLGKEAGISPFHLHRLFLNYTGEPLSGFIRRTRMAAGYRSFRRNDKATTIEIAMNSGYESASAFVRAFRRRFGFTPQESRTKGPRTLSLWRTQKSESKKLVVEPVRIEERDPLYVFGVMEFGYHGRSFQKVAARVFGHGLKLISEYSLHGSMGRACALMFDDPDLCDPSAVRYFGGFELIGPEPPSECGFTKIVLSSGTYGVFLHRGSYRNLWQTWNAAYRNWLPNSRFELRDATPFEVYLNDPRTIKRDRDLLTEIFIPIRVTTI